MAKPRQPEKGVTGYRKFRYGRSPGEIGPCTGVNKAHDKSTLQMTDLVEGINARVHDGIVVARGGQSLTESGMAGCVQGLIDVNGGGARMVLSSNDPSPKASVDVYDPSLPSGSNYFVLTDTPQLFDAHPPQGQIQGIETFNDTKPRYVYTWWDGFVVFQSSTDDKLYKVLLPEDKTDPDEVNVEELFLLQVPGEGSAFEVSSMTTMPNVGTVGGGEPLYFGTMAGGVVGYVNGQLVRLQADATFSSRVLVFQYNNRLYAAGTQELRVQDGWSTGGSPVSAAWSNVPLPAGAYPAGVSDFRPMCAIEHNGYGWIGGWDDDVTWVWNTTYPGFILKIDDSSGTPVCTVGYNGNNRVSFDDFAVALGNTLFVSFRHMTFAVAEFGGFATWDGTTLDVKNDVTWGESGGMVVRLAGNNSILFLSGWGSDTAPGIWSWNGSSSSRLINLDTEHNFTVGPFDMVLF